MGEVRQGGEGPHWAVVPSKKTKKIFKFYYNDEPMHFHFKKVILLYNYYRHVSVTHVTIFSVASTRI